MTRRATALLAVLVCLLATAAGIAVVTANPPAAQAQTLSGSQFDAGNIISDERFYDSKALSADGVQTFLDSKYSGCASGYVCLRDYTTATKSEPAESGLCAAYTGSASETAAQIIANVAAACGVNPESLLVLLQKESSLVTTTTPNYQTAAGYGCPDSTGCSSKYYGFFNQVYLAARQFKLYRLYPTNYNYVAGRSNYILYNPKTSCGGSQVFIQNQATAGLYDYTPYQPNAAALANLTGTGDSCSAYGNRNFWYFFNTWFSQPPAPYDSGGIVGVKADGTLWYYADSGDLTRPYATGTRIGVSGWQHLTHLASGDVTGDGLSDLVGTRPDGSLWLYANNGTALPYPSRVRIGASGWNAFDRIMLADVNGDGLADLVATRPSGSLVLYPNNGNPAHPFGAHQTIGASGWQNLPQITTGDVDGDGYADIVGMRTDGSLWLYRNTGDASRPFVTATRIGVSGWGAYDRIMLTDINADGLADVVARRPDGSLWAYLNAYGRADPLGPRTRIGASGWQVYTTLLPTDVPARRVPSPGNLVATQPAGTLWKYPNRAPHPYGSHTTIGTGWQAFDRLLLGDVDGDGRADMIGVRPDGTLWLYHNTGSAGHPFSGSARRQIGRSGWQHFVSLVAADVNGDKRVDLIGSRSDGTLWLYRNTGNAVDPFGHRTRIGASGWDSFDRLVAGDVNGDGRADLVATRPDGSLVRYLSNGSVSRPYGSRQEFALSGWQVYSAITAGNVDGDGRADLVASRPDGTLWLDRDAGTDRFPDVTQIGASGWQAFDTILAGDVTGDGLADLVTRTPRGSLRLYPNNGNADKVFVDGQQIGASGWQNLAPLSLGDVDADGLPDLVGVRSNGTLWLYHNDGDATRPFGSRVQIGRSGWTAYNALLAADVDGDGHADLIGRKPDGSLWLYRGTGDLTDPYTSAKTQIGSGWDQYDTILAADVNHDGLADLIARRPDGTLWLYLNDHDPADPFPSATQIGTGWQVYDKIAAGDVDHDGRADLVASMPDGTLWLYRNSGLVGDPFPSKAQVGSSGWAAYDRLLL